jgi:hypothetical protein
MFFSASGSLIAGREINMDMSGTIRNRIVRRHVTFKPLVHVPSLSYVERHPTAVLGLFGIDEIAWQRSESSVNRVNLVLILLAGLPKPTDEWGWRALRLWVMTE